MSRPPDRFTPDGPVGSFITGVHGFQRIFRPKIRTHDDYERWLTDTLALPELREICCSAFDCTESAAYTSDEWQTKGYLSLICGQTADVQVGRTLPNGWVYLRIWEHYYAFCPVHRAPWHELGINDAISWIYRLHNEKCITLPVRDRLFYAAMMWSARRFDLIQMRSRY